MFPLSATPHRKGRQEENSLEHRWIKKDEWHEDSGVDDDIELNESDEEILEQITKHINSGDEQPQNRTKVQPFTPKKDPQRSIEWREEPSIRPLPLSHEDDNSFSSSLRHSTPVRLNRGSLTERTPPSAFRKNSGVRSRPKISFEMDQPAISAVGRKNLTSDPVVPPTSSFHTLRQSTPLPARTSSARSPTRTLSSPHRPPHSTLQRPVSAHASPARSFQTQSAVSGKQRNAASSTPQMTNRTPTRLSKGRKLMTLEEQILAEIEDERKRKQEEAKAKEEQERTARTEQARQQAQKRAIERTRQMKEKMRNEEEERKWKEDEKWRRRDAELKRFFQQKEYEKKIMEQEKELIRLRKEEERRRKEDEWRRAEEERKAREEEERRKEEEERKRQLEMVRKQKKEEEKQHQVEQKRNQIRTRQTRRMVVGNTPSEQKENEGERQREEERKRRIGITAQQSHTPVRRTALREPRETTQPSKPTPKQATPSLSHPLSSERKTSRPVTANAQRDPTPTPKRTTRPVSATTPKQESRLTRTPTQTRPKSGQLAPTLKSLPKHTATPTQVRQPARKRVGSGPNFEMVMKEEKEQHSPPSVSTTRHSQLRSDRQIAQTGKQSPFRETLGDGAIGKSPIRAQHDLVVSMSPNVDESELEFFKRLERALKFEG
ncbi:hypothetical protein BLNAU_8254 [Blattamonas nauphoetae]|uniref:Uncharacterized protein n=1 Tax=Blattamonas nauphoetae TaxID=2049346 RepID=A0ABQ9XZ98_9EUKA|nr:hypothetical protein BLNAU_8254 [Blattamonas nauphoetae]